MLVSRAWRQAGDRPDVVPEGAVNFAFIGQFAESKQRDCIFTTEYSVRTPMEAVYTLLNVERGIPEVFNSTYDIRSLLAATGRLRDGEEFKIPGPAVLRKLLLNRIESAQIGALPKEFSPDRGMTVQKAARRRGRGMAADDQPARLEGAASSPSKRQARPADVSRLR